MRAGIFIMVLGGCVSTAELDQRLGSWVGKDADALAADWGAPAGNYQKKDGGRILSYERSSVVTTGPSGFSQTYSRHCRVDFTVDAQNKVTGGQWRGASDQCDRMILPGSPE